MDGYHVGLVCLNGHAINSHADTSPEFNTPHCTDCGAATISKCPHCDTRIHGKYEMDHIADLTSWHRPHHCHACGEPYPWTAAKQEALDEIIAELDRLSAEEVDRLRKSVPDIVADTPKTGLAVMLFKKALGKLDKVGSEVLMHALKDSATAGARELFGL